MAISVISGIAVIPEVIRFQKIYEYFRWHILNTIRIFNFFQNDL